MAYRDYPCLRKHPNADLVNDKLYHRSNATKRLNSFILNDSNRRLFKFRYELLHNEPRVVVVSKEPIWLRWVQNSQTNFDRDRKTEKIHNNYIICYRYSLGSLCFL